LSLLFFLFGGGLFRAVFVRLTNAFFDLKVVVLVMCFRQTNLINATLVGGLGGAG